MKNTRTAGRAAARLPQRTPWAIAAWLGLACAGSAQALTPLPPTVSGASTCFHKDRGFIGRAQLDFSTESPDGLFDIYKGAHYQGQWAFQNGQGQWVVQPPRLAWCPWPAARCATPSAARGLA